MTTTQAIRRIPPSPRSPMSSAFTICPAMSGSGAGICIRPPARTASTAAATVTASPTTAPCRLGTTGARRARTTMLASGLLVPLRASRTGIGRLRGRSRSGRADAGPLAGSDGYSVESKA